MQFVTIVNRTSKILKGTWDGRHYDIAPGKHSFPQIQAEKFKEQNPVMGSENPLTLQKQYLIGIVEQGDDVSPIEQSNAAELWDRKLDPSKRQDVEVVAANGLYNPRVDSSGPLPANSNFVKP